jgi:PucR C-terminal helix-turn-helix domain
VRRGPRPAGKTHLRLHARLLERRDEIEEAALTRAHAIADPGETDPVYREGLRAAVSIALDYAFEGIERGGEGVPPPPPALLAQARLAARAGIGLDTVLRRYCAGYVVLGDFLAAEMERPGTSAREFRALLRSQAGALDRLLAAVSEEHAREAEQFPVDQRQRRSGRLREILDGLAPGPGEFSYDFHAYHLGVHATGAGAGESVAAVARTLPCHCLVASPDAETSWIWLASRRPCSSLELEKALERNPPGGLVTIGEPAQGLSGWRLTHRQAVAAVPLARRGHARVVRYGTVAVLASAAQDELLGRSLHEMYLRRLGTAEKGGTARETLRAYFASERSTSSTAARLSVSRRTVSRRLQAIEERLGCSLSQNALGLEVALGLEELSRRRAGEEGVPTCPQGDAEGRRG